MRPWTLAVHVNKRLGVCVKNGNWAGGSQRDAGPKCAEQNPLPQAQFRFF